MKAWFQRLMQGRYGNDELNRFLSIITLILCLISVVTRLTILNSIALALMVLVLFRMMSRNTNKRIQENSAYWAVKNLFMQKINHVQSRMRMQKTYRIYKCPSCKKEVRVPKGKGNITIHCPACHQSFKKKT